MPTPAQVERMMSFVASCTDPKQLKQVAENARKTGEAKLEASALRRLFDILPAARPGTLEHDVWRSIHALEGVLSRERGKTTRLSRTRQKIGRDGEHKAVCDLVQRNQPSEGYSMLQARNMMDFAFEAVVLRHPERFEECVLEAARARLEETAAP